MEGEVDGLIHRSQNDIDCSLEVVVHLFSLLLSLLFLLLIIVCNQLLLVQPQPIEFLLFRVPRNTQ